MADPARAFFDTNVLVYFFDSASPAKRDRAERLVVEHREDRRLVVSTQVLQEFYWITTHKMRTPLTPARARREVARLAELDLVTVDAELVLTAIDRSEGSRISFWDGLIVQAALRARCTTLYSEDLQDGWLVDGRMKVVNPFV